MPEYLIETVNLKKYYESYSGPFYNRKKTVTKASDGVSVHVSEKETLGILGESGCGKSTLGRMILGLIKPDSGKVLYKGRELNGICPEMQIIFQDPYSSLDPSMTIGDSLREPMLINGIRGQEAEKKIFELLDNTGLSKDVLSRYPHQFSGGQRQRIVIARSLVLSPSFIVADEPVSALDVSIQAQILNLMEDLRKIYSLSFLFISHDLSVVNYISSRIAVMYKGTVVEEGPASAVCGDPQHPYTNLLVSSLPERYAESFEEPPRKKEEGACVFYHRCPIADSECASLIEKPVLKDIAEGRKAACIKLSASETSKN